MAGWCGTPVARASIVLSSSGRGHDPTAGGGAMRRREFITLIGGAAAWPLAARAQQREPMRRIGVLSAQPADDALSQARNAVFLQGLGEWGWSVGRNVQIDYRWGAGRNPAFAAELAAAAPAVILAVGSSVVGPLLAATRTVPVVFTLVAD